MKFLFRFAGPVRNSAIAGPSIRPLRMNTVNLPRASVSILKVIDQPTGDRRRGVMHCLASVRPAITGSATTCPVGSH
jgi:hypothetical protein